MVLSSLYGPQVLAWQLWGMLLMRQWWWPGVSPPWSGHHWASRHSEMQPTVSGGPKHNVSEVSFGFSSGRRGRKSVIWNSFLQKELPVCICLIVIQNSSCWTMLQVAYHSPQHPQALSCLSHVFRSVSHILYYLDSILKSIHWGFFLSIYI